MQTGAGKSAVVGPHFFPIMYSHQSDNRHYNVRQHKETLIFTRYWEIYSKTPSVIHHFCLLRFSNWEDIDTDKHCTTDKVELKGDDLFMSWLSLIEQDGVYNQNTVETHLNFYDPRGQRRWVVLVLRSIWNRQSFLEFPTIRGQRGWEMSVLQSEILLNSLKGNSCASMPLSSERFLAIYLQFSTFQRLSRDCKARESSRFWTVMCSWLVFVRVSSLFWGEDWKVSEEEACIIISPWGQLWHLFCVITLRCKLFQSRSGHELLRTAVIIFHENMILLRIPLTCKTREKITVVWWGGFGALSPHLCINLHDSNNWSATFSAQKEKHEIKPGDGVLTTIYVKRLILFQFGRCLRVDVLPKHLDHCHSDESSVSLEQPELGSMKYFFVTKNEATIK